MGRILDWVVVNKSMRRLITGGGRGLIRGEGAGLKRGRGRSEKPRANRVRWGGGKDKLHRSKHRGLSSMAYTLYMV